MNSSLYDWMFINTLVVNIYKNQWKKKHDKKLKYTGIIMIT